MYIYKELGLDDLEMIIHSYITSFNSFPWNDKWTYETAYKRLHAFINSEAIYGLGIYKDDRFYGELSKTRNLFMMGLSFV